jgi:D-beta-D-heptose 7-phosphate kinase/D-beta-D-heptose 1-phosphate adenosyltransferase
MAISNNIPVIVDSKAKDTLNKYKGVTIALPNLDEARLITKLDEFDDEDIARFLLKNMKLKAAALTLGPHGILLATSDGCSHFPTLSGDPDHEVADVTGAGDTVAATVAAGLTLGMSYPEIMRLANITAGIKVQKRGVATATPSEIFNAMEIHKLEI